MGRGGVGMQLKERPVPDPWGGACRAFLESGFFQKGPKECELSGLSGSPFDKMALWRPLPTVQAYLLPDFMWGDPCLLI